ncbi:hypothetical protein [Natronobiforma cellulositropha]|uniref:hypothetical protein n=1 Tax=Natronobiforma cellulositropha TaxID=1679076 RepID=UPI0021D5A5F8|nr:hypothetical protein [Natronobiforma cellulositropha]
MNASITSTDGQTVTIAVVDNWEREHTITVDEHGYIETHETADYSCDPADRTPEADEQLYQARRYARHTLAEETGELMVLLGEYPDLLDQVAGLVGELSDDRFEDLFGPLMQQFRSHTEPDVEPVIEVPDVDDKLFTYYTQILGFEESSSAGVNTRQQFADALGGAFVENQFSKSLGGDASSGVDFLADVRRVAQERGYDLSDLIDLTDLGTWFCRIDPDSGEEELLEATPVNEEPVAAISLPPIDPGTPTEFRRTLQHHLLCQARDSYIGMGVEPPEYFKVLGHGLPLMTQRYRASECYENYHDPDAPVSVWDPAKQFPK